MLCTHSNYKHHPLVFPTTQRQHPGAPYTHGTPPSPLPISTPPPTPSSSLLVAELIYLLPHLCLIVWWCMYVKGWGGWECVCVCVCVCRGVFFCVREYFFVSHHSPLISHHSPLIAHHFPSPFPQLPLSCPHPGHVAISTIKWRGPHHPQGPPSAHTRRGAVDWGPLCSICGGCSD